MGNDWDHYHYLFQWMGQKRSLNFVYIRHSTVQHIPVPLGKSLQTALKLASGLRVRQAAAVEVVRPWNLPSTEGMGQLLQGQ